MLLLLGLPLAAIPVAAVVINEVLSNAPGDDSGSSSPGDRFEFLELYNGTESTVDLEGYRVDDGDAGDAIVPWEGEELPWTGVITGSMLLAPGRFALVLDPEIADTGPAFPYPVPESTLVLSVANTTIGDGLSTTDFLLLSDAEGRLVDTFGTPDEDDGFPYDPGDGISLERKDPSVGDTPANWGPSISPEKATPGGANSLSRPTDGLLRDPLTPSKRVLSPGEEVDLAAVVTNFGRNPLPAFSVSFFSQEGIAGRFEGVAPFEVVSAPGGIAPAESTLVSVRWSSARQGFFSFMASLAVPGDAYPENDTAVVVVRVGEPIPPVLVNEIYAWREGEEPQWVELYNSSDLLFEVGGWIVSDESGEGCVLGGEGVYLAGRSYLVLTARKEEFLQENPEVPGFRVVESDSLPLLNKDGDSIVLRDAFGTGIDSVRYGGMPVGGVGVSWERVSTGVHSGLAANWALSLDPSGRTPGRKNSVALEKIPSRSALTVWPPFITPDGDGVNDRAFVSYRISSLSSTLSLRVFNSTGLEVAEIARGVRAGGEGSFLWDARARDGHVLPTGLYILLLESEEEGTETRTVMKRSVAVAPRF
jgi:hypothetical protein